MKKTKKAELKAKIKLYNALLGFFSFTFLVLAILVGTREYKALKTYNDSKKALETFETLTNIDGSTVAYEELDAKIGKYKIIGSIKIDAIGLEYPILEKTNKDSLWLSVTKLSGPPLNELGNVGIAGHNTRNGTLFGKLSNINKNDIIEITDTKNRTIKYQVYSIYSVLPTDLEPLKTTIDNKRELTLITCTGGGKKRLVVKALEID